MNNASITDRHPTPSADAHRAFSTSLAGFAGEARRIVEKKHRGSLVYAGGDDLLAFLPLPEALACADALRRRFGEAMAEACTALPEADRPTLSVGVGVGHLMESMNINRSTAVRATRATPRGTRPGAFDDRRD